VGSRFPYALSLYKTKYKNEINQHDTPQQKYIEDKLEAWDRKLMQQEKEAQMEKKKDFFSRLFS
jgi:hypothetical protein